MSRHYVLHIPIAKRNADTAFVFEAEQWQADADEVGCVVVVILPATPRLNPRSEAQ
jgi:hypothetical protein